MKGNVTHPPSLEPTEQPITTSEAEPEEEDDDDDDEVKAEEDDKDDYGDASNSADEDYSKEGKNAGDYGRGLWKTKDLPERGKIKFIS